MSEENAAPQVPLTARSGAEKTDVMDIDERNAHSAFPPAVAAFCEPSRGTMTREILDALRSGERLTPLLALQKYACLSLSQRIGELKRAGWPIKSAMVATPTGKRIAQYWISEVEAVRPGANAVGAELQPQGAGA